MRFQTHTVFRGLEPFLLGILAVSTAGAQEPMGSLTGLANYSRLPQLGNSINLELSPAIQRDLNRRLSPGRETVPHTLKERIEVDVKKARTLTSNKRVTNQSPLPAYASFLRGGTILADHWHPSTTYLSDEYLNFMADEILSGREFQGDRYREISSEKGALAGYDANRIPIGSGANVGSLVPRLFQLSGNENQLPPTGRTMATASLQGYYPNLESFSNPSQFDNSQSLAPNIPAPNIPAPSVPAPEWNGQTLSDGVGDYANSYDSD